MLYKIETQGKDVNIEIQEHQMHEPHNDLSKNALAQALGDKVKEQLYELLPNLGFGKFSEYDLCITFVQKNSLRIYMVGDNSFRTSLDPYERVLSILNNRLAHYWEELFKNKA